jgi:Arc/MetJ family transcription regulator
MWNMELAMHTTVKPDKELLAKAEEYTGIRDREGLVNEGLRALIRREAGRRLIDLGGTMPELGDIPRRRQEPS